MKLSVLGLIAGVLVSGTLLGCGGGGKTPPPPINITTMSLSQGQTSMAYSTTLSATGGTPPYSWSVKSGTLPAGLSLSTAGAISGTPTAAGAAAFAVQVSDSGMPSQSTSANLTLAISSGTLQITTTTAATGTVGTAYQFQLQATGGVPPYTWAVSTGASLPAGLSLSPAGVVSGTPTTAGTFNPSIAVTDETTTNTISQQVRFTINPAGTPLPDGGYAFQFNGTASSGNPVAISGSFLVAQGAIGIGAYSENELNQPPVIVQAFTGGSVSIAPNGLGQLVLDLPKGNVTFALAVPASATTANNDSDIRMIEFDDTTGSGMRGSGVLKTASLTPPPANLKGSYAFGFRGYNTHSQPVAVVGSFEADGSGNITSGSVDLNDNGKVTSSTSVTGATTPGDLGGLITLKIGSATLTFDYYQVSPTEFLTTSADQTSTTIPMVSGVVLQQTGPFTSASFTGANVFAMTGSALQPPTTYIPDVTLGLLTSNGKGSVSASYDEFKTSLTAQQTYTGTYTVDATTGRTPITVSSATKTVLYLVSNTTAFAFGGDTSTSSGLVETQSALPFANASLKGNYLGGTIPWPDIHVVSLVAADGNGNVQFTSDLSGPTGLMSNVTVSGTYSVDAAGRAVLTVAGDSTPEIFYVVSPTRTVFLSGEAGGFLASFEQ